MFASFLVLGFLLLLFHGSLLHVLSEFLRVVGDSNEVFSGKRNELIDELNSKFILVVQVGSEFLFSFVVKSLHFLD